MVAALRRAGIVQMDVLQAMAAVPRHFFLLDTMLHVHAYKLEALRLSFGDWREERQTISNPLTVAFQTQLLRLLPDDKVLEIGTGCGYQTAVLCAMGVRQVFSIERQHSLHLFAKGVLEKMGCPAVLIFGDGFEGLPQYAPFHKIIVTCGAEDVPANLQAQLAVGGRMVIPVGQKDRRKMLVVERTSASAFKVTDCGRCRDFVPMLTKRVY